MNLESEFTMVQKVEHLEVILTQTIQALDKLSDIQLRTAVSMLKMEHRIGELEAMQKGGERCE